MLHAKFNVLIQHFNLPIGKFCVYIGLKLTEIKIFDATIRNGILVRSKCIKTA